jgi:hypothetical protein
MLKAIEKKLRLPDLPEADRAQAKVKAQAIRIIQANPGDALHQDTGF